MIIQIFAIYDSKAGQFFSPNFYVNKATALRAFVDLVNDSTKPFQKHPEDYALFHIGEYDDEKGLLSGTAVPESMGLAQEYIERH